MKLTARMLSNVRDANSFEWAETVQMSEGDSPIVYFQLVDASLDRYNQGFSPAGRRYCPAAGSILMVVLDNVDDARVVTRVAMQPFPSDPSIWAISLMPTDKLVGTVNMKLNLTQAGVVTSGYLSAALSVDSLDGLTRL